MSLTEGIYVGHDYLSRQERPQGALIWLGIASITYADSDGAVLEEESFSGEDEVVRGIFEHFAFTNPLTFARAHPGLNLSITLQSQHKSSTINFHILGPHCLENVVVHSFRLIPPIRGRRRRGGTLQPRCSLRCQHHISPRRRTQYATDRKFCTREPMLL